MLPLGVAPGRALQVAVQDRRETSSRGPPWESCPILLGFSWDEYCAHVPGMALATCVSF